MRWAILGGKAECQRLARMLAAAPGIEPLLVPADEWESLLAGDDCQAVVVELGLEEPLRAEQLKKLVGAAIPVIAVHPSVDVLTAYELEVIRRESGGLLLPFGPGWYHPGWDRLAELVGTGSDATAGAEMVSFTRFLPDRSPNRVTIQLSQDLHILRRMLGPISSVTAAGMARSDGTWNSLTVQLAGERGCSAVWSLSLADSPAETHVTVSGNSVSAALRIAVSSGEETWELQDQKGNRTVLTAAPDAIHLAAQLEAVQRGEQAAPTWYDACLDLELADAVSRSMRRKRTIDLNTGERSEEQTFKSFMSAAGCLVLVAVLVVFLGLALWDGLRGPFREPSSPSTTAAADRSDSASSAVERWPLWARLWPVYPVVAFLVLQLLLLITRRPPPANRVPGPSSASS